LTDLQIAERQEVVDLVFKHIEECEVLERKRCELTCQSRQRKHLAKP